MINEFSRISQSIIKGSGLANKPSNTAIETVASSEVQSSSNSKISSLAQQLHEAQIRADVRDASLTRQELADKAKAIKSQFYGQNFVRNKLKYDAEVPSKNDPAHIQRAEQATQFVNDRGENPFKGFAPDHPIKFATLLFPNDKAYRNFVEWDLKQSEPMLPKVKGVVVLTRLLF